MLVFSLTTNHKHYAIQNCYSLYTLVLDTSHPAAAKLKYYCCEAAGFYISLPYSCMISESSEVSNYFFHEILPQA